MKTLYVSDLDGTLLSREARIPVYSIERLNRMIEAGMTFTFATARTAQSARAAVEGLCLRTPAILYGGGLIYDYASHETLRAVLFEKEVKEYVLSVLLTYGIQPFVYGASAEGTRELVVWNRQAETTGMQRYLSQRCGDSRLYPLDGGGELLNGFVFNFKCVGPAEQLEKAWNVLKFDSRLICLYHKETYQNDYWIEISPRESNKASAVAFLKERLGCGRGTCFGDSSNDSDMFDVCDEKYAVKNADDWLKAKATAVIGYCEEDGVAKWLESNAGFGL